jgi:hypothetical protein
MSFALHEALGVSSERGNELSALLAGLTHDPEQNMEEICEKLAEDHDPEVLLLGVYLGLAILENDSRVVPVGYRVDVRASVILEPEAAD